MVKDFQDKGYIARREQLMGYRKVQLTEGRAKGCSVIEVWTEKGLHAEILPDSGLDIGVVRFKGLNMSYLSKNGYDNPFLVNPLEKEFVNTFPGGMLYTCGLRQAGPPCRDNEEWHPQHGRCHGIPAEEVSCAIEGDEIIIKGKVRETALFGHSLELSRRISISDSSIKVDDELVNNAKSAQEFMILYHMNFGYPMLSEKAFLDFPNGMTSVRTDFSKAGLEDFKTVDCPKDNEEERVFFHDLEEYWVKLTNPEIGIAANLSWSGKTLPVLAHWRSMASGDYALGLEPANNYVLGRVKERENGTLKTILAGQAIEFGVELRFD
ncbi:MAG: aldose 1-epimerase family protein [Clostridiales bacterium]|jgi:hypothetical protein|nr:aldose 1-epimerase family protein [Clostridiales bacterium]